MAIGLKQEWKINPVTGQPEDPNAIKMPDRKYLGEADPTTTNNNNMPFGIEWNKKNKKYTYKDENGVIHDVEMEQSPGGKVKYYAIKYNMNPIDVVSTTDGVTPPEKTGTTKKEEKKSYRLPKEYLDAFMKMSQGENKEYNFNTYKPTDIGSSILASALKGVSEGAMTGVNKAVTADIGQREGIKMAADLGQAMKGDKNLFIKDGKLTGGQPIDVQDRIDAEIRQYEQIGRRIMKDRLNDAMALEKLRQAGMSMDGSIGLLNMLKSEGK